MSTRTRITVQSNVKSAVLGRIPALGAGGGKIITAALENVGREAVAVGRQVIQTTPSSIVPGKMDRVYTGRMLAAVNYLVTHSGKYNYNLYAGWIDGDPGYFQLQDEGGVSDWGIEIEGMFMMAQIREFVQIYARQVIEDAVHG